MGLDRLLGLVVTNAVFRNNGHLTILRFTTGWKAMFGTPDLDGGHGREDVWNRATYPTVVAALRALAKSRCITDAAIAEALEDGEL